MKCPKCGKQAECISHMRNRVGGKYVVTHDIYEHASRVEGGFRIVSSRDCCYVRLTKRAPDARKSAPKSRSKNSKGSAKPARG
jgi:hypothetical protein